MVTVYVLSSINLESATYAAAKCTVDCTKVLKDGYCMVMLNGRDLRRSVEMSQNEDEVKCVSAQLRTRYELCDDCKAILLHQLRKWYLSTGHGPSGQTGRNDFEF